VHIFWVFILNCNRDSVHLIALLYHYFPTHYLSKSRHFS